MPVRYQFAGVETLRVAESLDVARDGLAQETKHLSDGEGDSHAVRPIRMARYKAPQLTKRDD